MSILPPEKESKIGSKETENRRSNLYGTLPRIGIICAQGLGDGLIFHIAAHNLKKMGYEVTTFNDHLPHFQTWLQGYNLAKQPPSHLLSQLAENYDMLLLQHDNSPKAYAISALPIPVFRFFGSHHITKYGPITPFDYISDRTKPMVFNLMQAVRGWFGPCNSENGLMPPKGLIFNRYPRRVAIHPSSSSLERNWPYSKFEKVANFLERKGYDPFFITTCDHKPKFSNLDELASFLYESGAFLGNDSGPGHLASYLNIPSLIIGKEFHHLSLWQPGWRHAAVVTPPLWSTYFKWTRGHWNKFITTKKITKTLKYKVLETK